MWCKLQKFIATTGPPPIKQRKVLKTNESQGLLKPIGRMPNLPEDKIIAKYHFNGYHNYYRGKRFRINRCVSLNSAVQHMMNNGTLSILNGANN